MTSAVLESHNVIVGTERGSTEDGGSRLGSNLGSGGGSLRSPTDWASGRHDFGAGECVSRATVTNKITPRAPIKFETQLNGRKRRWEDTLREQEGIKSRLNLNQFAEAESDVSETLAQSYLAVKQLLYSADREGRRGCKKQKKESALVVTASVNLGGVQISAIIDSGATRSFVALDIAAKIRQQQQHSELGREGLTILTAKGKLPQGDYEVLEVPVRMDGSDYVVVEKIAVLPTLPEETTLLGMTFFQKSGCQIRSIIKQVKFEKYRLSGGFGGCVTSTYGESECDDVIHLVAVQDMKIAPGQMLGQAAGVEIHLQALCSAAEKERLMGQVRQTGKMATKNGIFVMPDTCTLHKGLAQVGIINLSDKCVNIQRGEVVAEFLGDQVNTNERKVLAAAPDLVNITEMVMAIQLEDGTVLGHPNVEREEKPQESIVLGGTKAQQQILERLVQQTGLLTPSESNFNSDGAWATGESLQMK